MVVMKGPIVVEGAREARDTEEVQRGFLEEVAFELGLVS